MKFTTKNHNAIFNHKYKTGNQQKQHSGGYKPLLPCNDTMKILQK
jgi:hypothetical protein